MITVIRFLAVVVSGVALIPSGAHLAALPNKLTLTQADYFVAQGLYAGWAILGVLWVAALLLDILLAAMVRRQRRAFWYAVAAGLCYALVFAIFFVWTFPANQATANWTVAPAGWDALRRTWEFSHAANAVLVFVAFCLATAAALASAGRRAGA